MTIKEKFNEIKSVELEAMSNWFDVNTKKQTDQLLDLIIDNRKLWKFDRTVNEWTIKDIKDMLSENSEAL